ncbi:MAG: insulinase family protein [Oscillospiraceae bacterium]|nr:insulinase family protein [Oscillospiraceae bacterium]
METSRVEIRPGVWLTHLREDKFKTACFSVSLLAQLSRDTASLNALIPFVLRRGTAAYPDMEAFNARCEDLYGTVAEPIVRRIGEIQSIGFYASFPEDDFLPDSESVLKNALDLTLSLVLSPMTRGGLLLPAYVDSEREKLLELIASRVNNKRSYAISRCLEEMCCYEDFAVSRFGDEASARGIHYQKLTRHYRFLLQTAPIELFYCGRASLRTVKTILRSLLVTLPRGELNEEIGTDVRMNAVEEIPRCTEEEMDVAQCNLVIGWRLGECMEDPDFPAIYVFNELFGSGPSSKLFLNVREKLSLCYYASSLIDVRKGLLLVSAGIPEAVVDQTKSEIFAQLESVCRGEFTDDDLAAAVAGVSSDLHAIPDTQSALESYYLSQALTGLDIGPEEMAELVSEVSRERVIAIAESVVCDQVYLLRPDPAGEEASEEEAGKEPCPDQEAEVPMESGV